MTSVIGRWTQKSECVQADSADPHHGEVSNPDWHRPTSPPVYGTHCIPFSRRPTTRSGSALMFSFSNASTDVVSAAVGAWGAIQTTRGRRKPCVCVRLPCSGDYP